MGRKGSARTKKENLRLKAYNSIKQEIVTLKLPPGSYIDKERIQKRLSLGLTPVREALLQLEAENLVTANPNKGFYVKDLNLQSIKDLLENRSLLERYIGFLAVKRVTEGEIEELEKIASEMKSLAENGREYELAMIEKEFHYLLVRSARNSQLEKIMSLIYNECLRIWFISHLEELSKSVDLHFNIVRSLRRRDWGTLEKEVIDHNTVFRRRVMGYIQNVLFPKPGVEETFKVEEPIE
ncbi:MAG: FCD domain-containing protein [candidate division Zixibacteria bacterium]|nr:FCD domain-containing protein [candidate division Zixibacteria bacterium]